MACVIIKEVNRMPGYTPSGDILAGHPVKLSNATTIIVYTWDNVGTAPEVLGIALETTTSWATIASIPVFKLTDSRGLVDPTMRPTSDEPSGDIVLTGTFYEQNNRGGLVSVALNGAVLDLYDDGRGAVYEAVPTTPYAVNGRLYADNESSLITADSTSATGWANKLIGVCLSTPATNSVLRMKLTI